jgi:hypothetical protein
MSARLDGGLQQVRLKVRAQIPGEQEKSLEELPAHLSEGGDYAIGGIAPLTSEGPTDGNVAAQAIRLGR